MASPRVLVTKLPSGKNRIVVEGIRASLRREWETHYPEWLIESILELKGPAFVCDEIARDESPEYTAVALKRMLLAYLEERQFERASILDFGCGAGAGTVSLSRSFPHARIVGVELRARSVEVARSRCRFYGLKNVEFLVSPSGSELPRDIGTFDFVVLSGVFEHLLPAERTAVMPMLWNALAPGGTLFIHETPNRHFPLETQYDVAAVDQLLARTARTLRGAALLPRQEQRARLDVAAQARHSRRIDCRDPAPAAERSPASAEPKWDQGSRGPVVRNEPERPLRPLEAPYSRADPLAEARRARVPAVPRARARKAALAMTDSSHFSPSTSPLRSRATASRKRFSRVSGRLAESIHPT